SSYVLPGALASVVPDDTIVVTGNGVAYTSTYQALPVKKGMRVFANQACASMGYGLPAAIGAACAGKGRLVCCITGDGSIQMNCQELQTLVNYRLPIKIFVYNNQGYLSIKLTQRAFFGGRFMGSEAHSGVRLPSLEKLASAYGIAYVQIDNNSQLIDRIQMTLAREGPVLVEVMSDPFEELGPKAASRQLPDGRMISAPLEDLAPFLPRTELEEQMSIALLPEF
ncbi:MAG: thiamine pyrophosphate-dependent enzyme, partial [Kiritimatiellia bacterium]